MGLFPFQGRQEALEFMFLDKIGFGTFNGGQKAFQIIPSHLNVDGLRRAPLTLSPLRYQPYWW